jgi:hypothetical protein
MKEIVKEIVHEVLNGITEGVLSAREKFAENGVRIAATGKRIDVEFNVNLGMSLAKFSIPIMIPNPKPNTVEPEVPRLPITSNTKIEDAGLSGRVRNCLHYNKIYTVRDLLAAHEREELTGLHRLGGVGLREIEDFVSEYETGGNNVAITHTA